MRQEDGSEIIERRALTQADIEQVPRENWEDCRFVNLHARDGEIVSCLIYGPDSEVVGSKRAFWWALAKVVVKMTDVKAGGTRMSVHGLAYVHNAARGMWDTVVERAGSIEELREEPVYMRNIHLDVVSKLVDQAQTPPEKLGLEICKAMVLAVQSEDDKLEAAAYKTLQALPVARGRRASGILRIRHAGACLVVEYALCCQGLGPLRKKWKGWKVVDHRKARQSDTSGMA